MEWDITVRQTCEYLLKYEYWCLYRNRSVSGKQEYSRSCAGIRKYSTTLKSIEQNKLHLFEIYEKTKLAINCYITF